LAVVAGADLQSVPKQNFLLAPICNWCQKYNHLKGHGFQIRASIFCELFGHGLQIRASNFCQHSI